MTEQARDALLALGSGAVLLGLIVADGATALLWRPSTVLTGVAVALLVEFAFVAGTRVARWWRRPWFRVGSALVLVAGAAALAWTAGAWILAAACWGLATYFVLLALLVTGVWNGELPWK